MSKHQACVKCRRDFVGPDSDIGLNLCPECDYEVHGECQKENDRLQKQVERMRRSLFDLLGEVPHPLNMGSGTYSEIWHRAADAAREE